MFFCKFLSESLSYSLSASPTVMDVFGPRNLVKNNTESDTSVQENIVLLYSLFPYLDSELRLS